MAAKLQKIFDGIKKIPKQERKKVLKNKDLVGFKVANAEKRMNDPTLPLEFTKTKETIKADYFGVLNNNGGYDIVPRSVYSGGYELSYHDAAGGKELFKSNYDAESTKGIWKWSSDQIGNVIPAQISADGKILKQGSMEFGEGMNGKPLFAKESSAGSGQRAAQKPEPRPKPEKPSTNNQHSGGGASKETSPASGQQAAEEVQKQVEQTVPPKSTGQTKVYPGTEPINDPIAQKMHFKTLPETRESKIDSRRQHIPTDAEAEVIGEARNLFQEARDEYKAGAGREAPKASGQQAAEEVQKQAEQTSPAKGGASAEEGFSNTGAGSEKDPMEDFFSEKLNQDGLSNADKYHIKSSRDNYRNYKALEGELEEGDVDGRAKLNKEFGIGKGVDSDEYFKQQANGEATTMDWIMGNHVPEIGLGTAMAGGAISACFSNKGKMSNSQLYGESF